MRSICPAARKRLRNDSASQGAGRLLRPRCTSRSGSTFSTAPSGMDHPSRSTCRRAGRIKHPCAFRSILSSQERRAGWLGRFVFITCRERLNSEVSADPLISIGGRSHDQRKVLQLPLQYLALHIHRTDFLSLDKSLFGTVALKSRPLQEVLSMGLKDSLR
jgi:hypothetical protein